MIELSSVLLPHYSRENVLLYEKIGEVHQRSDLWFAQSSRTLADYIVQWDVEEETPQLFRTLNAAIDKAILDSKRDFSGRRRIIEVWPGLYEGPFYIPKCAPPLLIQGLNRSGVVLFANIDAEMSGHEYALKFSSNFENSAKECQVIFASISALDRISTNNASVMSIEADDVKLLNMTIRNDYAADRLDAAPDDAIRDIDGRFSQGQHQAVALHVNGADRICLTNIGLHSFQDTLYLQANKHGKPSRTYLQNCYIEGDVDFIFGGATGFFEDCEIRTRGCRGAQSWALAPSTSMRQMYGFVFQQCKFTHDGSEFGQNGESFLGRQWFEGVRATPYGLSSADGYTCGLGDVNLYDPHFGQITKRTLEAVGKCILLSSDIGFHINQENPWDGWSSGHWNPRFRPVQNSALDFLDNLGDWTVDNGLDYSDLDSTEVWLGKW